MKVLQINTTANTGSTGRIAEEIGLMFQKQGHESFIACKRVGPSGSTSEIIRIGNKFDEYMHGIKSRGLDRHGFGSKRATENMVNEIDRIDPDIIGLHNVHGYYLNVEILFKYLKAVKKPIVWTLHDCWPFTGHCSHFEYVSCDKWKTECGKCPLYNRYPASWLVDNSKKNFHQKKKLFNGINNLTLVTPSHWLKNQVSESFLSDYPVEVIHNGIDLDFFQPIEKNELISTYGLSDKKVVLGVASVWDRIKGFEYFIDLSKRLDDSFQIILIGLTEKKIKELPKNIIGLQRTENVETLAAFYSVADVFVNPTLVDNFPTTNLEALACGTPVITFDTGGSPEAIDSETGIIVDKGNSNQLCEAVKKVTETMSQNLKHQCRSRAITCFNKTERYQDYVSLYKNILDTQLCKLKI